MRLTLMTHECGRVSFDSGIIEHVFPLSHDSCRLRLTVPVRGKKNRKHSALTVVKMRPVLRGKLKLIAEELLTERLARQIVSELSDRWAQVLSGVFLPTGLDFNHPIVSGGERGDTTSN